MKDIYTATETISPLTGSFIPPVSVTTSIAHSMVFLIQIPLIYIIYCDKQIRFPLGHK